MGLDRPVALDVRGITKTYSQSVSVGPISFHVREGEFFSLLGPSGCGKSTTLRCIAGFEAISTGEIYLNGQRLDRVPAYSRELGLVFQSHALFPHLSVEDNVAFGLKLRKVAPAEIAQRVSWALDLVGLAGLEKRAPSQISGGQQQRVALARSLVLKPPLLLLDEPLSSLDLKLRQQMRDELRNLQRQLGQTTIFVTHDQTEALAMSDRIAVLSNGRIEQIGTPEEIYRTPASEFVASFIGMANLIDATITAVEGGTIAIEAGGGVKLRAASDATRWRPGQSVLAVIRPEDVLLGDHPNPKANAFAARIFDIEYLGEDTQLRLDVTGLPPLHASLKTTRAAASKIASGQTLIEIDPADVYLISR